MIVSILDFKADPQGIMDSSQAFYKAFHLISQKQGAVTLKLEKGIYRLTKECSVERTVHTSNTDSVLFPKKKIGLLIESMNDLTIDGQGSRLLFEGDMMALGILHSKNITIKNLTWDFKVPTTSEMSVKDFNLEELWIDYLIPSCMPYQIEGNDLIWLSEKDSQGNYYWTEKNDHRNYGIQVNYPQVTMGRSYYTEDSPFRNVSHIEEIEANHLRFYYQQMPKIKPIIGMNYQFLSNAQRPTAGSLIWESKNICFENVKIRYMHGFGLLVQMSEDVSFDKIEMSTDKQTGRYTSSFADGIHVSGAKGKISICNSYFNNTHDDPINIHGTFTRVEERIDEYSMKLSYVHPQQGGFPQFYPGNEVVFYSRDQLQGFKDEKVYHVVSSKMSDDLKSMIVRFEEVLEDDLFSKIEDEGKYVAENITYTPEVMIKNNVFENVFTRSILLTTRKKAIIENNLFHGSTMATLFFSNDSDDWYESGPIRDLEIRGNTFYVRSIGRTWWKYAPAIYFYPVTKGKQLPKGSHAIHQNILIEQNTFYLESDGALRAESVKNLIFRKNKLVKLEQSELKEVVSPYFLSKKALGPEKNEGSKENVLEFKASENILIENNHYDSRLKKTILLESMSRKDIKINDSLEILFKNS